MTVSSGFFNSVNHDRTYSNIQMSSLFDGIINDGVFLNYLHHLYVRSGTNMQVIVGSGRAWFDHYWIYNDADLPLSIPSASQSQNRIDAIVIRIDANTSVRKSSIYVKTGTTSSNASKPSMEKTNVVHEYPLAYIHVNHGMSAISSSNIENRIGTNECPFATIVNNTFDSNKIISQWQSQYDDQMNKNRDEWRKFVDSAVTNPNTITSIPNSTIDHMFVF